MRARMLVVVLVGTLLGAAAPGYDLPPVNLGLTSFLDGGPPAGPGFYFTQYVTYWNADRLTDHRGDRLQLPIFGPDPGPPVAFEKDADLEAWIALSQFIYQSDTPVLFGGKWGLDVIVPLIYLDLDAKDSGFLRDNGGGLGDILVGPFLQWDPIMGEEGPLFMHRLELQMIFPTGKYDNNREVNPGSNFFHFNPYWAGTLFLTPRWTASTRLHYLWSANNTDPNKRLYPEVDRVRPGQAWHANFATDYEVIPQTLRLGINAFYLKQFESTKADGKRVSNSREQVLGIGPGAVWHLSQDSHIFLNTYWETQAENRPEGFRLGLRYVHHF